MDMDILEMCEDEQMDSLRATLLKCGRGRRPDLPHIEVTNKLLLQLFQLRFEGKKTTAEVEGWFLKLYPNVKLEGKRLWNRMKRVVKAAKGKTGDSLKVFLQEPIDFNWITDCLQAIGVTRIMDTDMFQKSTLTNEIVTDLGSFLVRQEGKSFLEFLKTLSLISLEGVNISSVVLRHRFQRAEKVQSQLTKNVGRNKDALSLWLAEPFPISSPATPSPPALPTPSLEPTILKPPSPPPPPPSSIADWPLLSFSPATPSPPALPTPSLEPTILKPSSPPPPPPSSIADWPLLSFSPATPALPISTPSLEPTILKPPSQSKISWPVSPPPSPASSSLKPVAPPTTPISLSKKLCDNGPLTLSVPSCSTALQCPPYTKLSPPTPSKVLSLKKDLSASQKEVAALKKDLKSLNSIFKQVKKSRVYKNNCILKKKVSHKKIIIKELKLKNCKLSKEIDALKLDKLSLQKKVSKNKKRCQELGKKYESLCYTINMIETIDDNVQKTNLKDDRYNKFKDSVRIAFMALQGEANVSAINCSKVVQIVAKHLFGHSFSLEDLPSTSSALNMMHEGNHIAKYQVVDEINKSNHFTYASDGTSRQKKHFMERHLVLNSGKTISMGFLSIAADDANNMLEQTIEVFNDFINVYCNDMSEEEKCKVFKDVISKMSCLMSDRAANMKLLNKKIHEWRKNVLDDDDITTHFLFCNAHFLLGLSNAAEKSILEFEKKVITENGGIRLGRDCQPQFKHFLSSSESAALRAIRTSAEVLGPRGDEKSGARQEWLSNCNELNVKSYFTSFRSNRFNNVFDNAHALLYHHEHIIEFIVNKASGENLKLRSIVADLKDPYVISVVAALSLVNLTISGPYWKLMNSSIPYGSFPIYVKKMKSSFDNFVAKNSFCASDIVSIFDDFAITDVCTIHYVQTLDDCFQQLVFDAFKGIVSEFRNVLERQLNDFLEDGVYGGEISENVKDILDVCPLTNLVGERMFGDLDYDMYRRKRASLHLRSTLNMWKHNDTVRWFGTLTEQEQKDILEVARRNCKSLSDKSKQQEDVVNEKIKQRMKENKRKRDEKDVNDKQKKASILDAIISQGKVCTCKEDLKGLSLQNLRDQIRYRKVFLGEKHLKLSGTRKELYDRLLQEIEHDLEGDGLDHKRINHGVGSENSSDDDASEI